MSKTVYLNISQITEVHHKEVQLKDVATVYCDDSAVTNKCNALRIKTIHLDRNKRYVESTLDVIKKITEMDPSITVNNVGEVDFIIDYHRSLQTGCGNGSRPYLSVLSVSAVRPLPS